MKKKILNSIIWSVSVVVFLILIWLIAYFITKNPTLVPSIKETFKSIFNYIGSNSFYKGLFSTLLRSFIAFIISLILAILCALISIRFKNFRKFLSPIISIIRSIPTMAITLLLLIYFNPSITPSIITFLVIFPMLYSQILTSYNTIDPKYFELAKVYNFSNKTIISKIILPNTFPYVLDNIGSDLSFSLKLTISAEVLAKTYNSLGYLLNDAKNYYETAAELFSLTIITIIISLLIEFIFYIISNNAFKKWRVKNDQN